MPRFKNVQWEPSSISQGNIASWEAVQLAVLLDIRDELQTLNRLLGCHNFVRIPKVLDAIAANTTKPKRKQATAK